MPRQGEDCKHMCGITGYFSPVLLQADEANHRLRTMARAIEARGPDGEGIWHDCEAGIGLAHRRLAILDLSAAGHQPMASDSGRFIVSYNGEIYNHIELRADLETAGKAPIWRGHSDTETLIAAIEAWGLDSTLNRTHGMFAIALWDRKVRRLSLARDRMGEKPLYWGWAGKTLVFGSQLKALRSHPNCPRDLCPDAVAQYMRFAYVPAPLSIHPGLYKLEPGCILQVDEAPPSAPPTTPLRPDMSHGSLSIRRFWSLEDTLAAGLANPFEDDAEALSVLEKTLSDAVARQTLSDVPLGAFLSGGVDSSLIVSLMQARATRPVKTFTIGFESAAYDESPHAAAVAKHLGTEHTEMIVTEAEALKVIPRLPGLYDEPFADSSQIPTFLVCLAAQEHVTVALSGDGGDELFGGYTRHLWAPRIWNSVGWMPPVLRQALGGAIGAIPTAAWDGLGALVGRISPRASVSRPGEKAHKLAERLRHAGSLEELYTSLAAVLPDLSDKGTSLPARLGDPLPANLMYDPAGWMMAQDMRTYLPDDILCKVDRAAMGVSLETRVPFLDPSVLQVAARMPTAMKLRNGGSKFPLRKILDKHVPNELIDRPKIGFGIPIEDWLRGPLKEWAWDAVTDKTFAGRPPSTRRTPNELPSWPEIMLSAWHAKLKEDENFKF